MNPGFTLKGSTRQKMSATTATAPNITSPLFLKPLQLSLFEENIISRICAPITAHQSTAPRQKRMDANAATPVSAGTMYRFNPLAEKGRLNEKE